MKYALLAIILCGSGLVALVKIRDWRMTPEQRAAEALAYENEAAAKLSASIAADDRQRAQNARVRSAREGFEFEMAKNEIVTSLQINAAGDVITVRLVPLAHIGIDHVRVLCEGVAYKWAAAAGLNLVRCESWYGNKMYAVGTYDGPIPAAFHERQLRESLADTPAVKAQMKEIDQTGECIKRLLDLRRQLDGMPYADVVAIHGEPQSKDATTGWARWRDFKAQFQTGKVTVVDVP